MISIVHTALLIGFGISTFFMRDKWSWRDWAFVRYSATVIVAVYLSFVFARSYNVITDRLEMDFSEALPSIGAILGGMLAGLIADIVVRAREWSKGALASDDFFARQPETKQHRVDFKI